jgi:hypothetical protein
MLDIVLAEVVEHGQSAEGEFASAAIVTTVKTAQPDTESEIGLRITSAVVEYHRMCLNKCGHIGCGNTISYNLN